jgi:arylsulfatase A-like enzyme
VQTLAEALRDASFDTAAITEGGLLAGARGFWFGFDRLVERHTIGGEAKQTFADGMRFLRRYQSRRFFLFLHTYETHGPYHVPPEYNDLFRGEDPTEVPAIRPTNPKRRSEKYDQYDRMIRETDDIMAEFLSELQRLRLSERTLVVLLSDHGEAHWQHGTQGHGYTSHREELHVPLILRGPGVPVGRRVDVIASLVDVAPTILDLLGLPPLRQGQGVSLKSSLHGDATPETRAIFFEWFNSSVGVRSGPFKLMLSGPAAREVLYHVEDDPWEKSPLPGMPRVRERLRQRIESYKRDSAQIAQSFEVQEFSEPESVDTEMLDVIRGLGYID